MSRKSTDFIVIHCADTYDHMDIGVAEIDRWHRARGFLKVGYQKVIRRDGTIEDGRGLHEAGAHAKGYNHRSIGICLVGGKAEDNGPENNFTAAQFASLEALLRSLLVQFPGAKIIGHNEISSKACPSFEVQTWLAEIGLVEATPQTRVCPTCGKPIDE